MSIHSLLKSIKHFIQTRSLLSLILLFPIVPISLLAIYMMSSAILSLIKDEILYRLSRPPKTTVKVQKFVSEFFPTEQSLEQPALKRVMKYNRSVLVLTHLSERPNTKKMPPSCIFATSLFGSWKLNVKTQRRGVMILERVFDVISELF